VIAVSNLVIGAAGAVVKALLGVFPSVAPPAQDGIVVMHKSSHLVLSSSFSILVFHLMSLLRLFRNIMWLHCIAHQSRSDFAIESDQMASFAVMNTFQLN
jgi:hypothetical protein